MVRSSDGEADAVNGVGTLTRARGTSAASIPRAFGAPWVRTRFAP